MKIHGKTKTVARSLILITVSTVSILGLLAYISLTSVEFTKFEAEQKPLPISAAIATIAPTEGWTKENYLNPKYPHFGVSFGSSVTEVDTYQALATHQVDTALVFKTWSNNKDFERLDLVNLNKRKIMPVLSWEPWDNKGSTTNQPEFTLRTIINGEHDDLLRKWASEIKALDFPIVLRFAHEMNGPWYPWSEQVNGNEKGEYISAWRHIHKIFEDVGAENIIWTWAPNVNRYLRNVPLADLYPGDSFVDLIGISGYSVDDKDDFETVYGSTISEIRTFTDRKILVTEIGVGGTGETRPIRIESLLTGLGKTPGVLGYVWFQKSKRENWKIDYSPETLVAYQNSSKAFFDEWMKLNNPSADLATALRKVGFISE